MRLEAVNTFVPEQRVPIEDLSIALELRPPETRMFRRYHGFDTVAMAEDRTLRELLLHPLGELVRTHATRVKSVRTLIYCHTIMSSVPVPATWLKSLALEAGLDRNVRTVGLTMAHCASSLVALDWAARIIEGHDESVIILAGEKCFAPIVQLIPGATIMGEAACAVLLCHHGQGPKVRHVRASFFGQFSVLDRRYERDTMRIFEEEYLDHLVEAVERGLAEAKLGWNDLRMVLPHNVNASSWRLACTRLGLAKERVYLENIARIGHCFGVDPYVNLQEARAKGCLAPGDKVLLVSAGLGATIATAVLEL